MPVFLVHHSNRVVLVTAPTMERARELAPAIAVSFEFRPISNPVGHSRAEASATSRAEGSGQAGLGTAR